MRRQDWEERGRRWQEPYYRGDWNEEQRFAGGYTGSERPEYDMDEGYGWSERSSYGRDRGPQYRTAYGRDYEEEERRMGGRGMGPGWRRGMGRGMGRGMRRSGARGMPGSWYDQDRETGYQRYGVGTSSDYLRSEDDEDQGTYRRNRGYGQGARYEEPTTMTYYEYWYVPGPFSGRGPKGYQRSNDTIFEDVCERLTQHGMLDARHIDVNVDNGEVTLKGTVNSRREKRMAEDSIETVPGVKDVHNELRVEQSQQGGQQTQGESQGQNRQQTSEQEQR